MKYEIFKHEELGYNSLMKYDTWRVAMLNYIDDCHVDHLRYLEAHHLTDEVFVLLEGKAILVFGDIVNNEITEIETISLQKHKVYNIKKDVYHTQILSEDAKLLIVEAADTGDDNSTKYYLNQKDIELIKEAL